MPTRPIRLSPAIALAAGFLAAPASAQQLPADGMSLGGNWRTAPSLDAPKLDPLAEGTPLRILADTGTAFNGYNWFAVEVNGRQGFVWGGILCSDGVRVPNLLQVCDGTATAGGGTPSASGGREPATWQPSPGSEATTADLAGKWATFPDLAAGETPNPCDQSSESNAWIEIGGNTIDFWYAKCTVSNAEPVMNGHRLIGSCQGPDRSWEFDTLAYPAQEGAMLTLIDQTGIGRDAVQVLRVCPP